MARGRAAGVRSFALRRRVKRGDEATERRELRSDCCSTCLLNLPFCCLDWLGSHSHAGVAGRVVDSLVLLADVGVLTQLAVAGGRELVALQDFLDRRRHEEVQEGEGIQGKKQRWEEE